MRIVFLASDLALPGQGMQLARLAAAAKEAGHEPLALSLGALGGPGEWLKARGVETRALSAKSWRTPLGLFKFAAATLKARPDVLQTWGFKANVAGKALGFFCGARNVVSSLRSLESPRRMEVERVTSFLCVKTVACGAWLLKAGEACGIPKGQLLQIPNCVDCAAIAWKERRKPAKDGKWKILCLGERSLASGAPLLLSALAGLDKAGMPFKAVLAGASPDERFEKGLLVQIEELGLAKKVELRGEQDASSVRRLMEDSHILVAPKLVDWTPNALLEAFASGLPAVAAGVEGVGELVTDGRTGRLAAPADANSLAKAIADAAMDYEGSLRMAREARRRAVELRAPSATTDAYLKLYESLVQKKTEA